MVFKGLNLTTGKKNITIWLINHQLYPRKNRAQAPIKKRAAQCFNIATGSQTNVYIAKAEEKAI